MAAQVMKTLFGMTCMLFNGQLASIMSSVFVLVSCLHYSYIEMFLLYLFTYIRSASRFTLFIRLTECPYLTLPQTFVSEISK